MQHQLFADRNIIAYIMHKQYLSTHKESQGTHPQVAACPFHQRRLYLQLIGLQVPKQSPNLHRQNAQRYPLE